MSLVDWIYPIICVECRKEGKYICDDCQRKLLKPEQICPMCCKPSLDGWTHPKCRSSWGMERLIVGLPYRGMVQRCLKKVKYKSAWEIIHFLFGLQKLDARIQPNIVTNVPMWRNKERERGFNQAKIIAELVGKNIDLIERIRETKPMYGLKKDERTENIEGAFRLKNQNTKVTEYQRIILVDDVWTTGATMRECTKVLKQAGAKEVWGVTLAR